MDSDWLFKRSNWTVPGGEICHDIFIEKNFSGHFNLTCCTLNKTSTEHLLNKPKKGRLTFNNGLLIGCR